MQLSGGVLIPYHFQPPRPEKNVQIHVQLKMFPKARETSREKRADTCTTRPPSFNFVTIKRYSLGKKRRVKNRSMQYFLKFTWVYPTSLLFIDFQKIAFNRLWKIFRKRGKRHEKSVPTKK